MTVALNVPNAQPEAAGLRNFLRNINGRRIEPPSKRKPLKYYYIYNVGPMQWNRGLGGMGTFAIFPCREGEEYAENAIKIPDFVEEWYEAGNQQINHREWDGMDLAKDILGILPPAHADNDLTHMGVFLSENNPPKKVELEEARAKLTVYFQELCLEGDLMAGGDDMSRSAIRNSLKHKTAAKYIGYEADWCTLPKIHVVCPACGGRVPKGAAVHADANCGAILDYEKARKFLPHLFANQEAKEPPARKI